MVKIEDVMPLGNKVLVLPDKRQEKTQSGIIIPIVVNKDIEEGTVVMASPQVLHINKGDKIMYPSRAGLPIAIEEVDYVLISGPVADGPGDIIAITKQAAKVNP